MSDFYGNRTSSEGGMMSNEERRNDPWVRSRVREVLEERRDLLRELKPHIDAMQEIVRRYPYPYSGESGNRLDERLVKAVRHMRSEYDDWHRPFRDSITETLIGNDAAFELGRSIVRRETRPE